jgi:hypothetical protein
MAAHVLPEVIQDTLSVANDLGKLRHH